MYLGIDISKTTIDCCLISDGLFFERKFENRESGFHKLQDWLAENGATDKLRCCCEATGKYYEALADFLAARHTISVENPRKIKGYATAKLQRSKTDKLDAKLIAEYCRDMNPRPWQKTDPAQTELKELTQYRQRLKRQKAAEQTKQQTAPDCLAPLIQKHIQEIQNLITEVDGQIKQFYKDHPDYKDQRKRLQTITGIGEAAADNLLSVLAAHHRFKTAKQLTAYLGLDPKLYKSGTSVNGREKISKVGSKNIRTALYMPAMHAYRSETFRSFVNRLQANGKRPKQIIVALMRKLAVIAYHLIKTGKDFEPKRYTG
ncbi:TPA: IS110 family transposase [Neisseria bacilliformis]